jgi:hypothetical protein
LAFDLRFVAAKVAADYAELLKRKQDGTTDYAMNFVWQELRLSFPATGAVALQ